MLNAFKHRTGNFNGITPIKYLSCLERLHRRAKLLYLTIANEIHKRTWKVGSRTTPGDWKIVLTAAGVGQIETYFTVTE